MKRLKTGGRTKGTPNKSTTKLKDLVYSFLHANIQDLQVEYDALKPSDKLDFFQKLLRFALPTQAQTRLDLERLSDDDLDNILERLKNNDL